MRTDQLRELRCGLPVKCLIVVATFYMVTLITLIEKGVIKLIDEKDKGKFVTELTYDICNPGY